jgi:phosphoribosylformylglycinamidine cyclo-ligase
MALTYRKSGVDIAKGNRLVDIIRPLAGSTSGRGTLGEVGSFGAFFRIGKGYEDPVLVSSTDGVGTKLRIAFMLNRHDTVGIDLVAMCLNDILTSGARPLFFLDYFSTGKLILNQAADVLKGIAEGCREANCALIGGETAEMPGFYRKGEYDMAGFAVGVVEKKRIINGSGVRKGDLIIGLASQGLHSNGYSLVRRLFFDIKKYNVRRKMPELGSILGDELLRPTRIYVKSVLKLTDKYRIGGMAHITGGGLTENVPRILGPGTGLKAVIEKSSWPAQGIFTLIQKEARVPEDEMYRTFNMGIGYVLIVREKDSQKIMRRLKSLGENAYVIGHIDKGRRGVQYR